MTVNAQAPDAVLVGYYKAGTTFLRGYFSAHPDIAWARTAGFVQMPDFMTALPNYGQERPANAKVFVDMFEGLSLQTNFTDTDRWVHQRFEPWSEEAIQVNPQQIGIVPERLKAIFPQTKVIVVLREQVSMMRSVYLHFLSALPVQTRGYDAFAQTVKGKYTLDSLHYDRALAGYFDAFGRDGVCVLLMEEFDDPASKARHRLCGFLGVAAMDFPIPEKEVRNAGRGNREGNLIRILASLGIDAAENRFLKTAARNGYIPGCGGDVLSESVKARIRAQFAASNAATTELTGLPLAEYGYAL